MGSGVAVKKRKGRVAHVRNSDWIVDDVHMSEMSLLYLLGVGATGAIVGEIEMVGEEVPIATGDPERLPPDLDDLAVFMEDGDLVAPGTRDDLELFFMDPPLPFPESPGAADPLPVPFPPGAILAPLPLEPPFPFPESPGAILAPLPLPPFPFPESPGAILAPLPLPPLPGAMVLEGSTPFPLEGMPGAMVLEGSTPFPLEGMPFPLEGVRMLLTSMSSSSSSSSSPVELVSIKIRRPRPLT